MDEKKPCKFCERLAWWKKKFPQRGGRPLHHVSSQSYHKNAQERRRRVRYGNASCRSAEFLP